MAKFTILTPAAASFTTSGGGYDYELEALEGMGIEIIECQPNEKDFIAKAGQADAVYAKGMQFNAKMCGKWIRVPKPSKTGAMPIQEWRPHTSYP